VPTRSSSAAGTAATAARLAVSFGVEKSSRVKIESCLPDGEILEQHNCDFRVEQFVHVRNSRHRLQR
jgi:hypothetical protein